MMVDIGPSTAQTLPNLLAARARAASDGSLVAAVAGGLFAAIGLALWHPVAWLIPFGASMSLAAFGAWGIADRELRERDAGQRNTPPQGRARRALRVVQIVAMIVGGLSAVAVCFSVLRVTLGTWIS